MKIQPISAQWHLGYVLFLGCVIADTPGANFRFAPVAEHSLGLWEDDRPVLVYNHGVIRRLDAPADRARSTYIHPIYGLDGEVLTDDFPKDHYHHRGLFWAWPHVKSGGNEYDLWMLKGVEQRFVKWLERKTKSDGASLGVENGWFVGSRQIMREQISVRVHPAGREARSIDLECEWTPLNDPITLAGAEGKSYGGLTLRFAPRTNTVITTPLGLEDKDLPMVRLPWADLSARFAGAAAPSGAAIFISPTHPDFPPMWLTRHYGVLCVGWPGVEAKTLPADKPVRCSYRVWVHRGAADIKRVETAFLEYKKTVEETAKR